MGPMEQLWEQIAKPAEDGQRYISYKTDQDLLFLWANGFVDFRKYTLADWIAAFHDSRQKDGSYRVTRAAWLAKERFRYAGPIGEPFDPQRLKEREYSEEEFAKILKAFVCPSTWIHEQNVPDIVAYFKKKQGLKGKVRIDKGVKREFQESLDKIPSPLRILQLDVARFSKGKPAKGGEKTAYQAGADAQRLAAERLAQLARTKEAPAAPLETPAIPLKELKKRKAPHRA